MPTYTLEITLQSDAAFGMGAGVSGLVDSEVQQTAFGLPTLSGRSIKGLLVNECSEILYALPDAQQAHWKAVAATLFGRRGDTQRKSTLFVGDAGIAPDLAAYLVKENKLSKQEILDALTDIRYQTAVNERGAPRDETLRAVRVLISGLTLYAALTFSAEPSADEKALLASCVLALRRAGLGRTRGKGKLSAKITDRPLAPNEFAACQATTNLTRNWFVTFEGESNV